MLCEYTFEVVATCPVDRKPDYYRCVVTARRTIPVEDILKAADALKGTPMFQEDFTLALHRALVARVETFGVHSGVRTRVACGDVE